MIICFAGAICLCSDEGQSKDIKVEEKRTSHGTNKRLDKNHPLANHKTCSSKDPGVRSEVTAAKWKPLLLIIPLRLGLSEINAVYIDSLKVCNMVHVHKVNCIHMTSM